MGLSLQILALAIPVVTWSMEGSPGPCFNPEVAGGAGDRNSWQAAGEGQLAPSHPHIRGGFLKLEAVNAEEELDHTRCPAATRRSAFFWFSLYLIAILMRQGKQEFGARWSHEVHLPPLG